MSFRLRFKYQVRHFFNSLSSLALPTWMAGTVARLVMIVLVVVLGAGYVLQTSEWSTTGYLMRDLERKVSRETAEIKKLETEVAGYQAMVSIQKRLVEVNMVPTPSVRYVKGAMDSVVAKR